MEKPISVIEITNTQVRVAVGYANNGKINIVHFSERPINGLINDGEITDFQTLIQIISSMREFKDDTTKEKFVINEATVILPAIGLNVFQSQKSSAVVSPYGTIQQLDIENVVSLVEKEPIPNGSEIVDIIPDSFVLEMGRSFIYPPISEKSNNITINAKIHTLPERLVNDYKRVVESAHIKIRRLSVNTYAICELGKNTESIPSSYILVDMGACMSSISLIGNHTPFETLSFTCGGNDLVHRISENFKLTFDESLEILKKYGLDERSLSYKPTIATSQVDGVVQKFYPSDLNAIIRKFFVDEFFNQFNVVFTNLMRNYPDQVRNLPVVFTGGFSKMFGFDVLVKEKFARNQSVHFLEPSNQGARNAKFSAIVGAMYIASKNKGALSDCRSKSIETQKIREDGK